MRWIWGGLFALLASAYGSWSLAGTIMFVMIAVIFLLFYARVNRWWYIRHNLRINSGPDGPRFGATKLELAGGQLLVEAPEGSSKLDLSAIRRIDECDTHFFIYTGPVSAIIVPKLGSQAEVFIRSVRSAKGPTYT
jgi:hypothetical protein